MANAVKGWWDRLAPQHQQAVYAAAAMLAIVWALAGLLYALMGGCWKHKANGASTKEDTQVSRLAQKWHPHSHASGVS